MNQPSPRRSTIKTPRGRRGAKPGTETKNKATTAEFDREDMGIAPKE